MHVSAIALLVNDWGHYDHSKNGKVSTCLQLQQNHRIVNKYIYIMKLWVWYVTSNELQTITWHDITSHEITWHEITSFHFTPQPFTLPHLTPPCKQPHYFMPRRKHDIIPHHIAAHYMTTTDTPRRHNHPPPKHHHQTERLQGAW